MRPSRSWAWHESLSDDEALARRPAHPATGALRGRRRPRMQSEGAEEARVRTSRSCRRRWWRDCERRIDDLVTERPLPEAFIVPGANPTSATLDVARAVVRRAERHVVELEASATGGEPESPPLPQPAERSAVRAGALGRRARASRRAADLRNEDDPVQDEGLGGRGRHRHDGSAPSPGHRGTCDPERASIHPRRSCHSIGVGADTLMLEAGPVVGPPTTQMSVTSKGIVKMTVPASAMLVVVPKNAPETESFGVCEVYSEEVGMPDRRTGRSPAASSSCACSPGGRPQRPAGRTTWPPTQ